MIRRLWARLLRRPGIQRHAVVGYRQVIDDALAAAERDMEFARAKVIAARTGEHDVLPEVDDMWREVARDYLERIWDMPARERAS